MCELRIDEDEMSGGFPKEALSRVDGSLQVGTIGDNNSAMLNELKDKRCLKIQKCRETKRNMQLC